MLACPEGEGANSCWAHTESEHEFWSHMNKGLHPGFIIHLLCDLHKLVNLLKPIGSAESGRNYLHLWEFGEI